MRILRITLYVTLFVLLTCKIIVGVTSYYYHRDNANQLRQAMQSLQQDNAALQAAGNALNTLGALKSNLSLYTALHDPACIITGNLQLDTLAAQLDAAGRQLLQNADGNNSTVTGLLQRKTAIYNRLAAPRQAPGPRLAAALATGIPALSTLVQDIQQTARQIETDRKAAITARTNESIQQMQNGFALVLVFLVLTAVVTGIIWWDYHRKDAQLRKEKRNALEAAKARSVFLANMSHEIRTPLNSVVGFAEQLTHTPLHENQRELLRAIDVSAGMLMNVVNDVLDFSKLDSDYISIQRQPFTLYQALADVVNSMRIQAVNKQLELHFSFEGNHQQHVLGDMFRLKQILVNLLANAIKYTETGRITVKGKLTCKDKQGMFSLAVEDTGPGVPPDILPRIFERFYQVHNPQHKVNGTGLGLAITQRLVQLHGGGISVESEVGKGTCFRCHIPYELATPPQTVVITQKDIEQMTGNQLEGLYVLIADDQEMNLLLLKMMLTRWKCRFDMAKDGAVAYELFKANSYDLVLLDLQMPEMTGTEVVQLIRADEDTQKSKVPVLVLTADIARHDEEAFRKAGFNDWMLKPFKEKEIYKSILKQLPRARIQAN